MFWALHGPLKMIGFTRNLLLGMIRVGFSASELHAAFHASKNAFKILEKLIEKENQLTEIFG